jgi:hypothetical protein
MVVTDLIPEMLTLILEHYDEGLFAWQKPLTRHLRQLSGEEDAKLVVMQQHRARMLEVLNRGELFFDAEAMEQELLRNNEDEHLDHYDKEDYARYTLQKAAKILEATKKKKTSATAGLVYCPMQGLLVLLRRLMTWSQVCPSFRAMIHWIEIYETLYSVLVPYFRFPESFHNPLGFHADVLYTDEYHRLLILDILLVDHDDPRKRCCDMGPVPLRDTGREDKINYLKSRMTSFATSTHEFDRISTRCWSHPGVEDAIRAERTACIAAWCATQIIQTRGGRKLPHRTCRITGRERPPRKLFSFLDTMALAYLEQDDTLIRDRYAIPTPNSEMVLLQYYDHLDDESYNSDDETNIHPPPDFGRLSTYRRSYTPSFSEDNDGDYSESESDPDDDGDNPFAVDTRFDGQARMFDDPDPWLFSSMSGTAENQSQVD